MHTLRVCQCLYPWVWTPLGSGIPALCWLVLWGPSLLMLADLTQGSLSPTGTCSFGNLGRGLEMFFPIKSAEVEERIISDFSMCSGQSWAPAAQPGLCVPVVFLGVWHFPRGTLFFHPRRQGKKTEKSHCQRLRTCLDISYKSVCALSVGCWQHTVN